MQCGAPQEQHSHSDALWWLHVFHRQGLEDLVRIEEKMDDTKYRAIHEENLFEPETEVHLQAGQ